MVGKVPLSCLGSVSAPQLHLKIDWHSLAAEDDLAQEVPFSDLVGGKEQDTDHRKCLSPSSLLCSRISLLNDSVSQTCSHPQPGTSLHLPLPRLRQDFHSALCLDGPHSRSYWRAPARLRVMQQGFLRFELARSPQANSHRPTTLQVSCRRLRQIVLPQNHAHQAHAPQPCRRRRNLFWHRRTHYDHEQLDFDEPMRFAAPHPFDFSSGSRATLLGRSQGRRRRLWHFVRIPGAACDRLPKHSVQRSSHVVLPLFKHKL